jgi:glutamyl-tRNA(Gln) amidotransferase subunit D
MSDKQTGYKGIAKLKLKKVEAEIGNLIQITKEGNSYEGILIPRSEYGDDKHIVIKNKSGYNLGIKVDSNTRIEKIKVQAKPSFKHPPLPEVKKNLPLVTILSTGGTIASRVDYRTGAVRPAITANDLYGIVPELSDIAIIETDVLLSVFSEDLTSKHWTVIAKAVANKISKNKSGVVLTHGTDTIGYTSAALSFALQNLPFPVVLVGAQRSEDRPSSDAALNLIGATFAAAKAPFAEVTVAMHDSISDKGVTLHRGTQVRKCHTSRRDAFKSINDKPIAKVLNEKIILLSENYRSRSNERRVILKPNFFEKVALVKFFPGMDPKVIEWYTDENYRGLILEGSGLGHVRREFFPSIKRALKKGVIVGMTSQCIWGRVNMMVYANGRDLLSMGVIPLENMLAETALVKLMWVLGQTEDPLEVRKLLITNFAGEITKRTIESIKKP